MIDIRDIKAKIAALEKHKSIFIPLDKAYAVKKDVNILAGAASKCLQDHCKIHYGKSRYMGIFAIKRHYGGNKIGITISRRWR